MRITHLRITVLLITLMVLLSACGGGGGTGDSASTGYFVDAPVEGLSYTTNSGISGTTGAGGRYRYRPGDTVEFKLGGLSLGLCRAGSVVTPVDLVPGAANASDTKVLKIVQLLLAANEYADTSSGIKIKSAIAGILSAHSLDLSADTSSFNTALTSLTGKTVTTGDAQSHLGMSLNLLEIAGNYEGQNTISGITQTNRVSIGIDGSFATTATAQGTTISAGGYITDVTKTGTATYNVTSNVYNASTGTYTTSGTITIDQSGNMQVTSFINGYGYLTVYLHRSNLAVSYTAGSMQTGTPGINQN